MHTHTDSTTWNSMSTTDAGVKFFRLRMYTRVCDTTSRTAANHETPRIMEQGAAPDMMLTLRKEDDLVVGLEVGSGEGAPGNGGVLRVQFRVAHPTDSVDLTHCGVAGRVAANVSKANSV